MEYLQTVIKQFEYYKNLGDKAMANLSEAQLLHVPNENSNSIAIIVNHLCGNMLSRWTDFMTTDGEKEWRNRDNEFEMELHTKEQVLEKWQQGWNVFLNALNSITNNELESIIYIRNQGHTVLEAINRQLAHYPYHIGQMVYIAKLLTEGNWQTLSIAKGKSNDFNAEKFAKEKSKGHYTDEVLQPKK